MGMYVSQLHSVPVGEYEYYVYLVDASEGAAHSPVIANALQGLAVQSGTVAVVVHGPGDLSMELFRFLQEQAPNDFSRLEHLFHETTALVISQGALQTTTSQVFVLPLLPASAVNSTHEELLSELVAQLLGAYAPRASRGVLHVPRGRANALDQLEERTACKHSPSVERSP